MDTTLVNSSNHQGYRGGGPSPSRHTPTPTVNSLQALEETWGGRWIIQGFVHLHERPLQGCRASQGGGSGQGWRLLGWRQG